jgi:hypothetical protein
MNKINFHGENLILRKNSHKIQVTNIFKIQPIKFLKHQLNFKNINLYKLSI